MLKVETIYNLALTTDQYRLVVKALGGRLNGWETQAAKDLENSLQQLRVQQLAQLAEQMKSLEDKLNGPGTSKASR